MIALILRAWGFLTFKAWRDNRRRAMRRARYEFLKQRISERHFDGYAGLIVDFPGRKFDKLDFASFKAPMYMWVKNQDMKWCVFWDRGRMAREIGAGAPLRDGEVLIPDPPGRTKPAAPETIDEKKPLTIVQTPPEMTTAPMVSDGQSV